MVDDDIDEPEDDDTNEDGEETCPICRGDMEIRTYATKSDPRLDLTWCKSGWFCYDCGYAGETWETVD
jgi:C4-type Zn-finger protein